MPTISWSPLIEWFYNELTVPVAQDPIGSYFIIPGSHFGLDESFENLLDLISAILFC